MLEEKQYNNDRKLTKKKIKTKKNEIRDFF